MAELEEVTVQYLSEEREPDGSRSQAQAEASSSGSWVNNLTKIIKSTYVPSCCRPSSWSSPDPNVLGRSTTYSYFMYNLTFHTYLLLLAYMPPSHAYLRTSVRYFTSFTHFAYELY